MCGPDGQAAWGGPGTLPARCLHPTGAVSTLTQEMVQGLLGLRLEELVTPDGFAPDGLQVHDVVTCSVSPGSTKCPGAAPTRAGCD